MFIHLIQQDRLGIRHDVRVPRLRRCFVRSSPDSSMSALAPLPAWCQHDLLSVLALRASAGKRLAGTLQTLQNLDVCQRPFQS